jgi:hypothetical protein
MRMNSTRIVWRAALVGVTCAILLGCSALPPYEWDEMTSVNVVKPRMSPVHIEALTPTQKDLYDQWGPPDFMRILYNPLATPASRWDLSPMDRRTMAIKYERSWIYLSRDQEIRFKGDADYSVNRLTDQIKLLCRLGDPEKVNRVPQGADQVFIEWVYYSIGERYRFDTEGRQLGKPMFFTGMGGRIPN